MKHLTIVVSILVRDVWNGTVEERLLPVEPMKETTAEALFNTAQRKLQQCRIEVANIRADRVMAVQIT